MNTPNPLVPQGSKLEQKSNARSRVKLAVFFVLTIHVVGLMALLVQGCRPDEQQVGDQPVPPPDMPDFATIPIAPVDTNEVLLPVVEDIPTGEGTPDMGYVPPTSIPVAPPIRETPTVQQYVIKKGDTYYSIGREFGVSMTAIKDANPGVDPTRLQVGQAVNIPPAAPAATETVMPNASGEIIHTVVSGENLTTIAKKYGTTWKAIQTLNNLPTTKIKVGDKLRVPAPQPAQGGSPDGF